MFEIVRERTFSASHQLRGCNGKCERLHGHNFRVRVAVASPDLDETGMVMDFHELDELLVSAIAPFDHRHLNDVAEFSLHNPSAEHLARAIGETISTSLAGKSIWLVYCDVFENDRSKARFYPGMRGYNRCRSNGV